MENKENIQQLKYTNVEGYINSQNKFGDEIQQLFSETYYRRELIFILFNKLQAYYSRNSSYIKNYLKSAEEDKKSLKDQLRDIRNKIYAKSFREEIKKYKDDNSYTIKEFDSIFNFLEDSFLKVNRDFSDTHLNPEAIDVTPEKEDWEKITGNKAEREYLKACTDMLKQNRKKSVEFNKRRLGIK